MTIRPVPQIAIDFIKQAEARPRASYLDSVGVLTGGWGHTGSDVPSAGTDVPEAKAVVWLLADLGAAARLLAQRLKPETIMGLSDHQYAALISFAFNLGASPKWRLWGLLDAGHLDQVPVQMMRFVNAGGKRLPGLVNRRTAEVALWNTPDASFSAHIMPEDPAPPSSETRAADTPPTPAPAKPLAPVALSTKIIGVIAAAGAGAKQVNDLIQPHADIHLFGEISAVLIGVTIVAGVVALWVSHQQEKARRT